jgi:hypothetical protein
VLKRKTVELQGFSFVAMLGGSVTVYGGGFSATVLQVADGFHIKRCIDAIGWKGMRPFPSVRIYIDEADRVVHIESHSDGSVPFPVGYDLSEIEE